MANKVPPVMNHRQLTELRVSGVTSFRETSVHKSHELMEFDEHVTDAEITSTIRYLDPELRSEREGKDTGAIAVCIALLIAITISSICLYVRTL